MKEESHETLDGNTTFTFLPGAVALHPLTNSFTSRDPSSACWDGGKGAEFEYNFIR